ncbi:hypothetical protein GCK32_020834 [Trichostrongylus colubriformis]|uniref:SH2 domain-containing protein n=1 Tax=Trichostrongylus colubriformis TaxID=6319 RepID=A0AAN8IT02_TRICO
MMEESRNQYERLLRCAGRQEDRGDQRKKVEMARFVDEDAERIMAELESESWYHGALPLEDVVGLIPERGDFLLRALEADAGRGPMVSC